MSSERGSKWRELSPFLLKTNQGSYGWRQEHVKQIFFCLLVCMETRDFSREFASLLTVTHFVLNFVRLDGNGGILS